MKTGDKVRFLNDVGGGIVKGFRDKNTVIVEDADGFDIPVPIRECVVANTDEYNIDIQQKKAFSAPAKKKTDDDEGGSTSIKSRLNETDTPDDEPESEPAEKPVTYKPDNMERKGGDRLNIYLCFVPVEVKSLTQTSFDTYLVNDSNYIINFNYLSGENKSWMTRYTGTAEPNTKLFMETVDREGLNELQHLCVQLTAFKVQKTFLLKPAMSVELRPDLTKFYKLHTFAPNDFFEERVLTFDIVRDDQPVRHIHISAEALKEMMTEEKSKQADDARPHIRAVAIRKEQHDDIDVVDLHASEILDTTRGMKPGDILDYQLDVFRRKMDENIGKKGKKIIFIHGKGQGVLRNAVLTELKHKYKNCTSQDASFREYGFGATMVIIH
jgi:hypothetical protein